MAEIGSRGNHAIAPVFPRSTSFPHLSENDPANLCFIQRSFSCTPVYLFHLAEWCSENRRLVSWFHSTCLYQCLSIYLNMLSLTFFLVFTHGQTENLWRALSIFIWHSMAHYLSLSTMIVILKFVLLFAFSLRFKFQLSAKNWLLFLQAGKFFFSFFFQK